MQYQKDLSTLKKFKYESIPTQTLPSAFETDKEEECPSVDSKTKRRRIVVITSGILFTLTLGVLVYRAQYASPANLMGMPDTRDYSLPQSPYSYMDPRKLILETDRTEISKPGPIFGELRDLDVPLPTNSWCENFFLGEGDRTDETNKVFQLPYVIEAYSFFHGVRTHPIRVQANDRSVMMLYEPDSGMVIGGVETFQAHEVAPDANLAIGRLSIVLQWKSTRYVQSAKAKKGPMMYTPIVRGSPYTSMVYSEATPRIYVQRTIMGDIIVDNNPDGEKLVCGKNYNQFSDKPILVKKELKISFAVSDMTWLVFVSEPTMFTCSNLYFSTAPMAKDVPAGFVPIQEKGWQNYGPHFDLRATKPMKKGMVRIILANNCTTGTHNAALCDTKPGVGRENEDFMKLIRDSSDLYATGDADVDFEFPAVSQEEDELQLKFNWRQNLMSRIHTLGPDQFFEIGPDAGKDSTGKELLMYAIPHHQERMMSILESSNRVLNIGCTPTLHGRACPVLGGKWSLVEHLHRVEFQAPRLPRIEMVPAIRKALYDDLDYEIPLNYMKGAGDTYFAGKMLAKLSRVLLIADEVGGANGELQDKFDRALVRLEQGIEVWLNGSALSPLLYDPFWGGVVACGCDYDGDTMGCHNRFPDCPALTDQGQNFGAGFYNDHHFHYGYHIYAAAVASKFDHVWGRKHFQRVLLLIRDIANPSAQDPYFPTWRHKDWYLGFSWASGIVTNRGKAYPNGRNQESISESIAAYEAVALYGKTMAFIYSTSTTNQDPHDKTNYQISSRIADMGRLLYATEARSAKIYWHVQKRQTGPNAIARIYPDVYAPKVVGMVWSLLAQEQTWFGNEPYKSYGIQLMPITAATELRDSPEWVAEMLPLFNQSCNENSGQYGCVNEGWSVLIHACQATIGQWKEAWANTMALNDTVYVSAGGNGHSKSNSLWFISTRPDADVLTVPAAAV